VPSALRHFFDAIKFEHTVFALPFAYIAMVLAARGWPGWWTVGWVTAAMIGARTAPVADPLGGRRITVFERPHAWDGAHRLRVCSTKGVITTSCLLQSKRSCHPPSSPTCSSGCIAGIRR